MAFQGGPDKLATGVGANSGSLMKFIAMRRACHFDRHINRKMTKPRSKTAEDTLTKSCTIVPTMGRFKPSTDKLVRSCYHARAVGRSARRKSQSRANTVSRNTGMACHGNL
jgi:hypothetical protein